MTENYGTFNYESNEITITENATPSNHVFTGWWGDAEEGEKYTAQYIARGIKETGEKVLVFWEFEVVKGQEPEDEGEYPFDDAHITKVQSIE